MPYKRHDLCWINEELRNYEKTKKHLTEQYENFAYIRKGGGYDEINVSGGRIGDPTAMAGVALYSSREIQHLEWIVDGIETAMEDWGYDERILYEMHYKDRKPTEYVMDNLFWSQRKYYYVRKRMLASIAGELGMRQQ